MTLLSEDLGWVFIRRLAGGFSADLAMAGGRGAGGGAEVLSGEVKRGYREGKRARRGLQACLAGMAGSGLADKRDDPNAFGAVALASSQGPPRLYC